ncbi:MAG: hypothetical protein N2043_06240 [Ignavibacterium sp.]|nr:hypothetical protein [Ignavibacterium sp.]
MISTSPFLPSSEVTNIKELFGRNKKGRELEEFITSVTVKKCNPQIIGERRSGKSSLIKCAKAFIDSNSEYENYIVIILNFKSFQSVKGISNGYKLLTSKLLQELISKKIFDSFKIYQKLGIATNVTLENIYNELESLNKRGEFIFIKLIELTLSQGFNVILVIDEYESMFFSTFQGEIGSVHTIRDLVIQSSNYETKFTCSITGARSWDYYASDVGSDDFNFIDDTIFIKKLYLEETTELFEYYYSFCSVELKNNLSDWEKNIEMIYKLSGGWPYILKIIGNEYSTSGEINIDRIKERTKSHFNNILQRLTAEQKKTLISKINSEYSNQLLKLGLLEKIDGRIEINGEIFESFVNENLKNEEFTAGLTELTSINKRIEIQQLASDTTDLMTEINETLLAKNKEPIFNFKLSINFPLYCKNLSQFCENLENFKSFISSLYIIVFEATQKSIIDDKSSNKTKVVNLATLPDKFSRKYNNEPDIIHHIDVLRHKFLGAHDTLNDNWKVRRFDPFTSQEHFLGHRNTPDESEYYKLQKGILYEFNNFLSELLDWCKQN